MTETAINKGYIDNILISIRNRTSNNRLVLNLFVRDVKALYGSINKELFDFWKNESKEFRGLLKNLGILDFGFEDFICFSEGKYDIYIKIKPYDISLKDTIKIVKHFASLMKIDLENIDIKSEHYKKLNIILASYNILIQIFNLYNEFWDIDKIDFDRVICSYSSKELEKLLKDYDIYINSSNKDKSFLINLNNKYREVVFIKNFFNRFFIMISNDYQSELEIVRYLFNKQSEERKKLIIDYTNHKLSGRTAQGGRVWNWIQTMKKQFKNIKENGYQAEKTIYDYFPLSPEIDENLRKYIVDKLLNNLNQERRNRINLYVSGQIKTRSELGNKARSDIQILQKQYKREIESLNKPEKTIYDAFQDVPQISLYDKKEIIDYLMAKLPEERRLNLEKYILGEKLDQTLLEKKAKADLQTMRIRYYKIATKGLLHKTIYDLFLNISGITEAEKREVVDNLFRDMPPDRKNLIDKLISLEINSSSVEGKQAYNDIKIKQRQFVKYIEERKDFVNNVALVIKEKYGIIININISFAKIDLLFMAVRIIEFIYRLKNKKTKKEFQLYLDSLIKKIYEENPDFDFENLLETFIDMAYENLKEDVLVKL